MYPLTVLGLVTVLLVSGLTAVALPSPTPGHLVVSNALTSDGHGGCLGNATAIYGFKATDVASGWQFDVDSSCNVVNVTWIVGSPVQTVPPVGPHYVFMDNAWAVLEQKKLTGSSRDWWLDDVSTKANFVVTTPCQATAPTTPQPLEQISLLHSYVSPADLTPASLYLNNQVVSLPNVDHPCNTVAESDFVCNTDVVTANGDQYVCPALTYGTAYGATVGHGALQHLISYSGSGYSCTTFAKENVNLQPWTFYSHQACRENSDGSASSWVADPTKVFTTVSTGQTADFTVN